MRVVNFRCRLQNVVPSQLILKPLSVSERPKRGTMLECGVQLCTAQLAKGQYIFLLAK